ncbi:hypothetical protein GALL_464410 [mine drainage metagenome]|uniref:Uncharacterized protein n=1 Tax=mine drainage metagenome TaxID=410659 RepID=A0A1J5PMB6_9ZZZZ
MMVLTWTGNDSYTAPSLSTLARKSPLSSTARRLQASAPMPLPQITVCALTASDSPQRRARCSAASSRASSAASNGILANVRPSGISASPARPHSHIASSTRLKRRSSGAASTDGKTPWRRASSRTLENVALPCSQRLVCRPMSSPDDSMGMPSSRHRPSLAVTTTTRRPVQS